jgi:hypothetical protein
LVSWGKCAHNVHLSYNLQSVELEPVELEPVELEPVELEPVELAIDGSILVMDLSIYN